MKILIVDDEPLARERIREMLGRHSGIDAIDEAENGGEAIASIRKQIPDVVFLDIQMPDMDGFEMLENLGAEKLAQIPAIIFVTAFDRHALRAFEFHALDYLLKPFDRERFAGALSRARAQIDLRSDSGASRRILNLLKEMNAAPDYLDWLSVKKDERIKFFKTADVRWIEAQGNYVRLKFAEGSEMLRETMDGIETRLDPQRFLRIHRSAIINVDHLKELQVWRRGEYRVVMNDGKTFPLSRSYRHRFDELLKKRLI